MARRPPRSRDRQPAHRSGGASSRGASRRGRWRARSGHDSARSAAAGRTVGTAARSHTQAARVPSASPGARRSPSGSRRSTGGGRVALLDGVGGEGWDVVDAQLVDFGATFSCDSHLHDPTTTLPSVTEANLDAEKKLAAEAAAELVEDGMTVGLGTGSTVAHLLPAIANRGLSDLRCVATSEATDQHAREL